MTDEQKAKRRAVSRRYGQTTRGRACFLRQAYIRTDACDLSATEVFEIISRPCVYCGTVSEPRGLDRIDNASGHVRGNVLPACVHCNMARGDRLTVAEMMIVGEAIRKVLAAR